MNIYKFNHLYGSVPKDDIELTSIPIPAIEEEKKSFHDIEPLLLTKPNCDNATNVKLSLNKISVLSHYDIIVIANTMNALLGVSIFSMPWGYTQSGVLGGSILLIIIGLLSFETARILLVSQKLLFQRTGDIKSYPEIAALTMGSYWSSIVSSATVISCVVSSLNCLMIT